MPPLAADFTPLSPQAQLSLVSILVVVGLLIGIWANIRRKPPLDSELVKLNTAIDGLQKAVDKLTESAEDHAGHASELSALREKVRTLESHREEDLRTQREYTRRSAQDIFAKLDGLKDSLSGNLQSVERAMGRVEGELKTLASNVSANDTRVQLELNSLREHIRTD